MSTGTLTVTAYLTTNFKGATTFLSINGVRYKMRIKKSAIAWIFGIDVFLILGVSGVGCAVAMIRDALTWKSADSQVVQSQTVVVECYTNSMDGRTIS